MGKFITNLLKKFSDIDIDSLLKEQDRLKLENENLSVQLKRTSQDYVSLNNKNKELQEALNEALANAEAAGDSSNKEIEALKEEISKL